MKVATQAETRSSRTSTSSQGQPRLRRCLEVARLPARTQDARVEDHRHQPDRLPGRGHADGRAQSPSLPRAVRERRRGHLRNRRRAQGDRAGARASTCWSWPATAARPTSGWQHSREPSSANQDFIYICFDNESYMNTGGQRSGTTPFGARTSTTRSAASSRGRTGSPRCGRTWWRSWPPTTCHTSPPRRWGSRSISWRR